MKKVLIINTIGLNYEGITSVIKNYVSAMDYTELEFHFVARTDTPTSLKCLFEQYGIVHCVEDRKSSLLRYLSGIGALLKTGFSAIHIHGNSGTMLIEVVLAKLYGVKNIIIHSHSTKTDHPVVNSLLKKAMMRMADTCIACSRASGDWLYGDYPHIILNNAVDLSSFCYSEDYREKYREEFDVGDHFLIGHIGHFSEPKNHFFLIDIFYAFHKLEPKSKLLLISDGPRFERVKEKVAELGLQDAVIFAGRRNDIAGIYSAMDLFILPSRWEGLPLVLLEAQANGLQVLASDVITKDAICTDNIRYKPLEDGAVSWAEQIQIIQHTHHDRLADTHTSIAKKGFDIYTEAEKLRKIYLK